MNTVEILLGIPLYVIAAVLCALWIREELKEFKEEIKRKKARKEEEFKKDITELVDNKINEGHNKMTIEELENLK